MRAGWHRQGDGWKHDSDTGDDDSHASLGTPVGGAALGSSWGRSESGSTSDNFKVVVRVRPPCLREERRRFVNVVSVPPEDPPRTITITEVISTDDGRTGGVYASQTFTFDRVYDRESTQHDVYQNTARAAVEAVLAGYNATMIAYGQTGTGKTYTMEGFTEEEARGIIPRATEDIFDFTGSIPAGTSFVVRASYLQIYNEVISDLLRADRSNLQIRECRERGVYVERLSEWVVKSPQEIFGLMEQGDRKRVTGNTRMSELSSRSHAIFRIVCEMTTEREDEGEVRKVGKLNIVDLAGSEKVRQTGAIGKRLEESKYINRSLSHLGNVIAALTTLGVRQHVPYRDSKLTRILADSLGGNCKTTMIATISPAQESYAETLSTLKYANRAKDIRNHATVNEDVDNMALIKRYERELNGLRAEVASRKHLKDLVDRNRQSEQDLDAALSALHEQEEEMAEERVQQQHLAQKLAELESSHPVMIPSADDDNFRSAIFKVSEQYMSRLDELDKKRQVIEEDKAQVERYKRLLLTQRDNMIALTARLNERDGLIMNQQEELDAYEGQQRIMEEALDARTEQVLRVQAGQCCPHCCGSGPVNQPSDRFVLSELRRCEGSWLREDVRLDDAQDPPPSAHISTHEKIRELYSHLLSLRRELDAQPSNIRQRLADTQEEQGCLRYLLSERVQSAARDEAAELDTQHRRAVQQWRQRHRAVESQLRIAECAVALSRLGGRSGSGQAEVPLRECVTEELAALRSQADERAAELRREALEADQGQRRAAAEVQRLRSELAGLRSRLGISDATALPDLDGLWARVVQLEGAARETQSGSGDGRSATPARDRVRALEAKVEVTQWQHQQYRTEVTESLEKKEEAARLLREEVARLQRESGAGDKQSSTAELSGLKRAVATHTKDRRALKTIMEARVKKKVDTIADALRGCHLPTLPTEQRHRIEAEVSQLQELIDASIKAI